jgi:hypothetical protein
MSVLFPQFRFKRVRAGMRPCVVRQLLGRPRQVWRSGEHIVWEHNLGAVTRRGVHPALLKFCKVYFLRGLVVECYDTSEFERPEPRTTEYVAKRTSSKAG